MGRSLSVTVIATGYNRTKNKFKTPTETYETNQEIVFDLSKEIMTDGASEDVSEETKQERKQTTIFDALGDYTDNETLAANRKIEQMKQRMRYLKELNETANKENGIEELEGVPAYKRKGVKLDEISHSSDMDISRTSLVEEPDKKPELRSNNAFLHDNVD